MKKCIVVLVMVMLAGSTYGQLLFAGTREISLGGDLDFEGANGTSLDLDVGYGYFIMDDLEVIGRFGFYDDDLYSAYALGFGAQFNFDFGTEFVPFAGADLSWGAIKWDEDDDSGDKNAIVLGLEGGANYFIAENVAISVSLNLDIATDDIFPEDNGKFSSTDTTILCGMRFFFD